MTKNQLIEKLQRLPVDPDLPVLVLGVGDADASWITAVQLEYKVFAENVPHVDGTVIIERAVVLS